MREAETGLAAAQYTIGIITAESSAFPDMQHFLAPRFKATLAQIPQDVLAQAVDEHMKADHAVAKN
jgi:hypothetical protein